jgi:hypothetical protein
VCRIPHVNLLGYDAASGDMLLYNFWKDSKVIINANIIVWTFTNARLCLDISIVSKIISIRFSSLFTVSFRIRRGFGAKQPWTRTNLLLPNGLQSSILMSWLGKKRCVVIFTLLEIFVLRDMIQRNLHCFHYIKFMF